MSLGLNIGLISNLNNKDRISCLSYLFASTCAFENMSVTVWDLTPDIYLVKARVWDYIKVLHGKFSSSNPVDQIIYRNSTIDHFGMMGDETAIRDVNFIIIDNKRKYSSTEILSLEAYCDKFIFITAFNSNVEEVALLDNFQTSKMIELWYYSNVDNKLIQDHLKKYSSYYSGQGYQFGEIIPKKEAIKGYFTFFESPSEQDLVSSWSTAITKLFYHASK